MNWYEIKCSNNIEKTKYCITSINFYEGFFSIIWSSIVRVGKIASKKVKQRVGVCIQTSFHNIKCFIKGILCLTFIGWSLQSDGYLNPIKTPNTLLYTYVSTLFVTPYKI